MQIVQNEKDSGHPWLAKMSQVWLETQKGVIDLILGATTPTNVALGIATGGESAAAQIGKLGVGAYFGYRGSQALLQGHLDGESQAEEIRRRATGAAQLVLGAGGAVTGAVGAKEVVASNIRNNLGLSGDLAEKVQAKVEAAKQAEGVAALQQAGVKGSAQSQMDKVQNVSQDVAASTAKDVEMSLKQIQTLATQEIATQRGKFESEYVALNKQATDPVTTVPDIKAEVINSLKSKGVSDAEIAKLESKMFISLPEPPKTGVRAPTTSESSASVLASNLSRSGMSYEDIQKTLNNSGYVPVQVDTAMAMAFPQIKPDAKFDVTFEMSRRLKTDLYEAQQSATDMTVRQGLGVALDNVNGIRQRYANERGFGKTASELDTRYMKFMREMGSGTMNDFIKAYDYADQNTILATARHFNSDSGEPLRGLLDLVGVDTSPLKAALEKQKEFSSLPESAIPDIQAQAKGFLSQIEQQKNEAVKTIGEANPIIPGKSDLALEGKGSLQIRLDALREISNNARTSGITNPGAYLQLMYGTARMAFGSQMGAFSAMSGGSRLAVEGMLKNKGFQDWVAQESGVTEEAMPKFRKGLSNSYPFLKKLAVANVIAAGASNTRKPIDISKAPNRQPQPAPANGQIRIAP